MTENFKISFLLKNINYFSWELRKFVKINKSRLWSDCPALELPENASELKCQKATCAIICKVK